MNRDEKNLQTRRKIIDSALQEFSEKSYGDASLNAICTAGNISKGIIYHYFKDKDALYLSCVKKCFDELTEYLATLKVEKDLSVNVALGNYFDGRIAFFGMHPLYLKLFCSAVMTPPTHLSAEIGEIRIDFDALNVSTLTKILKNEKLRSDVTLEEVVEVFREYQDFVNTRFQMQDFWRKHAERTRRPMQSFFENFDLRRDR